MFPEIECMSAQCTEMTSSSFKDGSDLCNLDAQTWKFHEQKVNWLTEYRLVCESEYLRSCGITAYFVGFFMTVYVTAILVDKMGRRPVGVYYSAGLLLTLILQRFSSVLEEVFLFRFVFGFLHGGLSLAGLLLCLESTSQGIGWLLCTLGSIGFSLGGSLMSYLGLHRDEWQTTFDIPICAALTAFLIIYLALPESPCWFYSQGRTLQALVSFNEVASINRRPLLKNVWLKEVNEPESTTETLRKLGPVICKLAVAWLAAATCYLVLPTAGAPGEAFSLPIYRGLVALPLKLLVYKLAEVAGRTKALMIVSLVTAVAVLLDGVVKIEPGTTGHLLLGVVSDSISDTMIPLLYIYTAELLPTHFRARGIGLCTMASAATSVFSPFILLLDNVNSILVLIVPIALLTLTVILASYTPETLDVPLPLTLEDAIVQQPVNRTDTEMRNLLDSVSSED
eukprot:sb/3464582/